MSDIVKVLVFSITSYVFLFIIAKLLGKKQIAQLSFIDYVVGITIGSIAAEMATETTKPFYHYLIAMAVFFLFDMLVSLLGRKNAFLKKLVNGKPIILIENGKIDYKKLKKSKLCIDEVCGMARDKNIFDLNDIAYAIFETNGKLSILPKSPKQPLVAENLDIKLPAPSLTEYLIIDGKICKDSLKSSNMTEEWLLGRLNIANKADINNILVASYDNTADNFYVQTKNEI